MVSFFMQILNISISASYFVLAVIAIRFLWKRIPKSCICLLWMLVGIRLVVPSLPETSFSLLPSNQVFCDSEKYDNLSIIRTGYKELDNTANEYVQGLYQSQRNANPQSMSAFQKNILWGTGLWIVGIGVLLGYFLYSWWKVKSSISTAIPEEIEGIKVYRSDMIFDPFLFGVLSPKIYVPYGLEGAQLQSVICHERSHLERKDYILKPAFYLVLILHWFNPLIWIAYALLCEDIEFACDGRVMRKLGEDGKKQYAEALLACSVNRNHLSGCPVAFGEGNVKNRIKQILSYRKPTPWLLAGAGIICVMLILGFMTGKKSDENTIVYDDYKISLSNAVACQETGILEVELRIHSDKADKASLEAFAQRLQIGSLVATMDNSCYMENDTEYIKHLHGSFGEDIEKAMVLHFSDEQWNYHELGSFPISAIQYEEARIFETDSAFGKVRITISPTTLKIECLEDKPQTRKIYAFILETTTGQRWKIARYPLIVSEEPEYQCDKEIEYEFGMEKEENGKKVWSFTLAEEIVPDEIAGIVVEERNK